MNQKKLDLLIMLADAFNKQYPVSVFEKWVELLRQVHVDAVENAISYLLQNSKFMPTFSEIYEACLQSAVSGGKVIGTWSQTEAEQFLEKADEVTEV